MSGFRFHAIALAIGVAAGASASAAAQTLSKEEYNSAKDGIAAELKAAMADCQSLSANAKDICKAKAGGREQIAKAVLEARYAPSEEASFKVRVARADADYSVAKEMCDDSAGTVKDVCLKEAKAAAVAARANAKARMETANADSVAREKGIAARKSAASDKRDADYEVAKEKCNSFAGDAKANCVNDAKAHFGKS